MARFLRSRPSRPLPRTLVCLLVMAAAAPLLAGTPAPAQPSPAPGGDRDAFPLDPAVVGPSGLDGIAGRVALETPQGALERFRSAVLAGDYAAAAHVLNMAAIPADARARRADELARRLAFVIDAALAIDWSRVPDRPDGAIANPQTGGPPAARRSISLGSVGADGRAIPVTLQRFAPPEGQPVWLFSPQTVAEIDELYQAHQPGLLLRHLPLDQWERSMGPTWWAWGAILAIALASLVTGWVVARLAYCLMRRADAAMGRRLRDDTGSALTSVLGLAIFVNAVPALVAPTGPVSGQVDAIGIVLLYVAMVWLAAKILWSVGEALSDRYVRRLQDPGNLHARRMRTKISVGRRLLIVLALVFGIGVTLMQLDLFGAIGLSLLASAGAVTVLVSIAARPFLENMLAGIQIALTEPVRIGDTVVIDGRWGTVETIAFTYVTVLTWDFKRLVVPHRHLLGEPFENWSKKDEAVKIPVSLKVDPALDIALLRRRYEEVIDADPRWHGEDRRLEVMEVGEEAVEVRAIASGASAADAWNLHVSLREALLGFLQTHEGGRYLVHRRHRLAEAAREALAASGGDGRGDREATGEDEAAEARHAL